MREVKPDLHLHTTASDGALRPAEMVRAAAAAGMTVIAVTDHDAVGGVRQAQAAAQDAGLALIPGIELSCGQGEEIHLLGYGLDPEGPALTAFLAAQNDSRAERLAAMVEKLRALGMDVSLADANNIDGTFSGRMPLADALVRKGYVRTAKEAFGRFLNPGRPAYVARRRVGVAEGIRALASFGAVPVLAHPGRLQMPDAALSALLPEWMDAGLCGIEAYHASHDAAACAHYDRMARANGLLVTGGSDCHGRSEGAQIGDHLCHWRSAGDDTRALLARLEGTPIRQP